MTDPRITDPTPSARATRVGLALLGVLLIGANLRPSLTAVGPVIEEIRVTTELSATEASLLITLPVICFAIVSPLAPRLSSRFPLGGLLASCSLLLAAGIVLRSLPAMPLLWVGSALLGIAIGAMNVLLPALVKRDFPERIGAVTGLYSCVQGSVAALASGIAVPIAGTAQDGWRLAIGLWAGLALIAFAVLLPQWRARAAAAAPRLPPAAEPRLRGFSLRSPLAWQVTGYMATGSVIYYAFIAWWPSFAREEGFSSSAAGLQLLVLQLVGIVGSLCAATLIHRSTVQSRLGMGISSAYILALLGLLLFPALGVVWAALAGFAAGAGIVLALSLFGLRTRDQEGAAALSGMAQCVGYAVAACGPVLLGALHDASGSWTASLLILLAIALAQVPIAYLAGRRRVIAAPAGL